MSLSCKRPALWAPGALPTVDFLLHHLGAVVKKMGVKSLVGPAADPTGRAPAPKANGGAEAPPWIGRCLACAVQCIDGCIVAVESAGGVSIAATRFFTAF